MLSLPRSSLTIITSHLSSQSSPLFIPPNSHHYLSHSPSQSSSLITTSHTH
ncbi:hypothetical protein E2C01_096600 [Portunus trituberculatus]|uniref:Uncharacterized protein n=1 Tax=Portunus trituberculatus TaxID=210409 RepID=A0A5B7K799_PORTR|nr:hypothetical protein [Portunus trituberculatus]